MAPFSVSNADLMTVLVHYQMFPFVHNVHVATFIRNNSLLLAIHMSNVHLPLHIVCLGRAQLIVV